MADSSTHSTSTAPTSDVIATLAAGLSAAPPRSAEIAKRIAFDGLSVERLSALYGINNEAAARLVVRALRDVTAAAPTSKSGAEIQADETEASMALELRTFLETPGEGFTASSQTQKLVEVLSALSQHKSALRLALADLERGQERSALWRSRLALTAIVLASAYFWWRQR